MTIIFFVIFFSFCVSLSHSFRQYQELAFLIISLSSCFKGVMATANLQFLFSTVLFAALLIQGTATQSQLLHQQGGFNSHPSARLSVQNNEDGGWGKWSSRREMIGSTAPTCTYNECRGCKFQCSAKQIPVDGNDPIHSAYHYKCVCHR